MMRVTYLFLKIDKPMNYRRSSIDMWASATIIVSILLYIVLCSKSTTTDQIEEIDYAEYVNPLMGTLSSFELSNGNTYPAIAVPWGMHFWTPHSGKMGDGWAYRYDHHYLRGFKQTHQPSPWLNDYGQVSLMPVRDFNTVDQDSRMSWYSHKSEIAKPYYYSVYLADHDITTEFTATSRSAYFQLTYPESELSGLIIDAFDGGSYIKVVDNYTIEGYSTKNSGGVGENFKNWFVLKFAEPFEEVKLYSDGEVIEGGSECTSNHTIAAVRFNTKRHDKKNVRIASSFIDIEQAYTNLEESEGRDFTALVEKNHQEWNDVLSKVAVESDNEEQLRTFYSCLYRSTLFPRALYEVSKGGEIRHYSPYSSKVEEGYLYGDTGFWDTFRALMPLLNLAYPDMADKMQQGLLNTQRESGFFPEWATPGHRDCMIGNNSASVVADAYLRGISDFDPEEMYQGLLKGANSVHPEVWSTGRAGYEEYNTLGYVPMDIGIRESAARTLEYAYNDWCIWKMGEALGRPKSETDIYKKRAENYKNLFSKEYNLMRGRDSNGEFEANFSPYKWGGVFTEGNSWHYTFSVLHDIAGLGELMGGRESLSTMLDSLFVVPPIYDDSYYGFRIHEITEMQIANMGNYAHGNQPAQHIPYLYNWTGEPWKTQYWVREVLDRLYKPTPDGYCGDEDNGQTSAWYVFSSLGFYPVAPATGEYALGAPLFKHATITRPDGSVIEISAEDSSPENRYVQSVELNSEELQRNFITFEELKDGATLEFTMESEPNYSYRSEPSAAPYSMSTNL